MRRRRRSCAFIVLLVVTGLLLAVAARGRNSIRRTHPPEHGARQSDRAQPPTGRLRRPALLVLLIAAGLIVGAASLPRLGDRLALPSPELEGPACQPVPTDPVDVATEPPPIPEPVPVDPDSGPLVTAAPILLLIEELGVRAQIEQAGVLADGGMEVPRDVRVVGWYATEDRRVSPGDHGMAVIVGHRDSLSQGKGALYDLARLVPGALVNIVHADGRRSTWLVDESLTTPCDALPCDIVFARDGPPRLALVTCGGSFDPRTRRYTHNIIVLARLVTDEDLDDRG